MLLTLLKYLFYQDWNGQYHDSYDHKWWLLIKGFTSYCNSRTSHLSGSSLYRLPIPFQKMTNDDNADTKNAEKLWIIINDFIENIDAYKILVSWLPSGD